MPVAIIAVLAAAFMAIVWPGSTSNSVKPKTGGVFAPPNLTIISSKTFTAGVTTHSATDKP